MTLDLFLKIVSTLATLIIGVAASALAYQQFRINKAKLKFDLYEKRLALFRRAHEFIDLVGTDSIADSIHEPDEIRQSANKFTHDTVEVKFLFEKNIEALFHELHLKAWQLADIEAQRKKNDSPELRKQAIDVRVWLNGTGIDMAEAFHKDLGIKALR